MATSLAGIPLQTSLADIPLHASPCPRLACLRLGTPHPQWAYGARGTVGGYPRKTIVEGKRASSSA